MNIWGNQNLTLFLLCQKKKQFNTSDKAILLHIPELRFCHINALDGLPTS